MIENAVKYSPPDSPIAVTCSSANGSNIVEVQDRGIGVPRAEREKIFEKFYRGRQATDLNVEGVGSGPALSSPISRCFSAPQGIPRVSVECRMPFKRFGVLPRPGHYSW